MQTAAVLLVACGAKAKKHLVLVRTCLSAVFLMMPRCSAVLEMRVVLPPSLPFSASPQRTRWVSSRQSYSHRGGCYSRWSDMGPQCMPGPRGGRDVRPPTRCFSLPHTAETGKAASCSPHDICPKER